MVQDDSRRISIPELYDIAIKTYGEDNQKIVAIEEFSELQKELCKDLRGKLDIDHLAEEFADVSIMEAQLTKIYGDDFVVKMLRTRAKKLERLFNRLQEEGAISKDITW